VTGAGFRLQVKAVPFVHILNASGGFKIRAKRSFSQVLKGKALDDLGFACPLLFSSSLYYTEGNEFKVEICAFLYYTINEKKIRSI